MIPGWLHSLSLVSVWLGIGCAGIICADEIRYPQTMWIMNIVWPITALFGTLIWLAAYFVYGRVSSRRRAALAKPFAVMVGEAASHCGAGCSLGDLCAETLAVSFPMVAVWAGWHTLFPEKMFAVWVLDFLFAYAFGILFQYFTIAPMRGLKFRDGIWAAVKADTLSLVAWQVGMYGLMAAAQFRLFLPKFGVSLEADRVEFWFVMQLAMIAGFITAYPVNWGLLKFGLKERM